MALFNIFNPKKKPLQTPANQIQGSGYGSAYASNPTSNQSYSSAHSAPTPTRTQRPTPSPVPTPAQKPISSVQSGQSGQYMSKAVPQIQGSGYGSNYASNPSNYKPVTSVPTPQPRQQAQPQQSANSSWMDYVTKATDRQRQSAEQQGQQAKDFINQKYDLANKQLGEQLPAAQETFNRFKGNTEASIADLLAGGERQKSQARDYYGEAQRGAAQTLRETQGQTQRTFAGLGSLDSRGEGSFAQANENTMSDFNRYTQQTLKAQADQLSEIDMQVSQAERSARDTIATEEAKMSELARNIQYAQASNNLQEAQELTQAFNESQQYIYDIEDALAQTKYSFALEQEKLENAMAKIQSFTPEFMATGQPTNQAEYEFYIKNKDEMQGLYGGGQAGEGQNKALSMVNSLLGGDVDAISGGFRPGSAPVLNKIFGGGQESAQWEGLKNLLTLARRGELKGSGAVSDFETRMLEKAALAGLDPTKQSEEQFRAGLEQLARDLQSQGAYDPRMANRQSLESLIQG